MKSATVLSKWGRLLVAILFMLFVPASSGLLSAGVAHAEGSRDLYPSGASGFRANLEWRDTFYGPPTDGSTGFLRRRSLLQVYAEPEEVLLMGSSAVGVSRRANIELYSSDQVTGRIGDETITGPPDFSCVAQRAATGDPDQGRITSRAQELAGPQAVTGGGNPAGYVPCYYEVPDGGSADNIYYVAFYGPRGSASNEENFPSGRIDLITGDPLDFGPGQNTSVSAWDVTVRSDLTSTEDITGRLFSDYLAMITGRTSRPLFSTLYALTIDSYIYEVGLRGLDPYGFVLYANDVGFLDSEGAIPPALYHDVLADPTIPVQEQNQLNVLVGDVSLAEPTHHLFFSTPSPEARSALNATNYWDGVDPIIPRINLFVFEGVLGDNSTLPGAGGTFALNVNVRGNFLLVISRDGVDFDPNNLENRTLPGVGTPFPDPDDRQEIAWDGLDNAGNEFGEAGNCYPAQIQLRAGEVHFPLLDVENSQQGGPQYFLTNPPDGCPPFAGGCFGGFYNDLGYRTFGGDDVGTPGEVLPCPVQNPTGCNPPPTPRSDPSIGFDTRTDQRAFGDGSEGGFGDKKGIDLWTYYTAEGETDLCISQSPLRISKSSGCYCPGERDIVTFTIKYANDGTEPALDATVTDTLPEAMTFVPSRSDPTCDETSPGSRVVVCSLGTLNPGPEGSLTLTARVDDDATGRLTNRARLEAANLDPARATYVPELCCRTRNGNGGPTIPEPTTLALVGLGLAGLAGYARRRRQRRVA